MDPISPGDYVVCIDTRPNPERGNRCPLQLGGLYLVKACATDPAGNSGFELHGIRSSGWRGGFHGWRFRPVYRRDHGLIERLCRGLPALLPA